MNDESKNDLANADADKSLATEAGNGRAVPEIEQLRTYGQIKLKLADIFHVIRQGFLTLDRQNAENDFRSLMAKLAEDRFVLAVLGQFKRGKSSLMNAIIGEPLLPTGVLPLTSAITILKYGPRKKILVDRENSLFPQELPVSALPEFVTEKGNPGNQKKVKAVFVETPFPLLRYGFEFVDTPGVGSIINANTDTTYNFLPECDAVLFVTGADSPMTTIEQEFLEKIKEYVSKIFFVINKIDLVAGSERQEIVSYVTEAIGTRIDHAAIKIYPISSQLALAARVSANAVLYEQSGLRALEDQLISFLSLEKSTLFLSSVIQKALRILSTEESQDIFSEKYLTERKKAIKTNKVTFFGDPIDAALSIVNARDKLVLLDSMMREKQFNEAGSTNMEDIEFSQDKLLKKEEPAIQDTQVSPKINTDIFSDLNAKGCPVCNHLANQAFDFFSHYQYKLSLDDETQTGFAKEFGFCPLHTWQLISISSPQGASIGYAKFVERVAYLLSKGDLISTNLDLIRHLALDSNNCRVCKLLSKAETNYIQQLLTKINDSDSRKKYSNSQGVCLKHLYMLSDIASEEIRNFLFSHEQLLFEHDAEDMRNYSLKHEALRRDLQNTNEKDAYWRAMVRIVGDKRVCMPWPEDKEI
ncbi:MAG TPA: DUF6062 family protein [Puia sp.]|nr:DUF6062 family protein [Puia sp.]